MEGRKVLASVVIFAVTVAFATLARGQAMGKVAVDVDSPATMPAANFSKQLQPGAISARPVSAGENDGSRLPNFAMLTAAAPTAQPQTSAGPSPVVPLQFEKMAAESPAPAAVPAQEAFGAARNANPAVVAVAPHPTAIPPTPIATPTTTPVAIPAAPVAATTKPAAISTIEQQPIRKAVPAETQSASNQSAGWGMKLPAGVASVLQVAFALAVVIGLIFLGRACIRRFVPSAKAGSGKGVIEVVARYPLSKNQVLLLVRIGSQIIALNQGKEQSQSVLVINDAGEVARILGQIQGAQPQSIQADFNRLLANARMDLEDPLNDPDRDDAESRAMDAENLDDQLEEMAAAKRQLMELRNQVRAVRDHLPRA